MLRAFMGFKTPSSVLCSTGPRVKASVLTGIVGGVESCLVGRNTRFHFRAYLGSVRVGRGTLRTLIARSSAIVPTSITVLTLKRDTESAFVVLRQRRLPVRTGGFTIKFHIRRPRRVVSSTVCKGKGEGTLQLPTTPCGIASGFPGKHKMCSFYVYPNNCIMGTSSVGRGAYIGNVDCSNEDKGGTGSTVVISISPTSCKTRSPLSNVRFRRALRRGACRLKGKGVPRRLFNSCQRGVTDRKCKSFGSRAGKRAYFTGLENLVARSVRRSFLLKVRRFSGVVPRFSQSSTVLSNVRAHASSPIQVVQSAGKRDHIRKVCPNKRNTKCTKNVVSTTVSNLHLTSSIVGHCRPIC